MGELTGKEKVGYFLTGMFGFLPGVLASWLIGSDSGRWAAGGKRWAWFGCLFWLIVGPLLAISLTLVAGILGLAFPEAVSFHYDF